MDRMFPSTDPWAAPVIPRLAGRTTTSPVTIPSTCLSVMLIPPLPVALTHSPTHSPVTSTFGDWVPEVAQPATSRHPRRSDWNEPFSFITVLLFDDLIRSKQEGLRHRET